ncbi:MAG: hypothetical protein PHN75_17630 [Syntrophales bacterium]|nr:hypothetical protein [Syntrophales bacterium]
MRKCSLAIGLCFLMMFAMIGSAFAVDKYQKAFNTRYGKAGMTINNCMVCHPGGNGLIVNAFAIDFANAGNNFAVIEHMDSDGDGYANIVEIYKETNPGDPESHPPAYAPDNTAPKVTAFKIPRTASSLRITVTAFNALDDRAVTGYLLTETPEAPSPSAPYWSITKPVRYGFDSAGLKTLYAWARDAAGNISTPVRAVTKITLPDNTARRDTAMPSLVKRGI